MRLRFLAYLALSLLLLFGLDRLFYNSLIFSVPNPSGWDSFRWYNFEKNYRELVDWRKGHPKDRLLLLVGSSIARYAVQAHVLEALLRGQGLSIHVRNFNHAAMMPADLYFYRDRLRHIRPDWILYVSNPADLDLERYTEPWQAARDYETKEALRFLSLRHPARLLYPGNFANYFGLHFGLDDFLERRLYAGFYSLRLREEWWEPWKFYWNARGGFVKGYLNYQGIRIREGLWRTGHTIGCLSLPRSVLSSERGGLFRFEVPPALFADASLQDPFFLEVYEVSRPPSLQASAKSPKSTASDLQAVQNFLWRPQSHPLVRGLQGRLARILPKLVQREAPPDCRVPRGSRFLGKVVPKKLGWQALPLPENKQAGLWIRLSHLVDRHNKRFRAHPESIGRGIRLPAFFGLHELVRGDVYVRRPDWEGREIHLSGDEGARRIFLERNEPKDWRMRPANRQLNFLRLGKYYTNWYEFRPQDMPQAHFLRLFLEVMRQQGTKAIFINNPENPITLADYSGLGKAPLSPWYRGYLSYLGEICKNPDCYFFDHHRDLSERYFSDAHHLTYEGMLLMSVPYSKEIRETMQNDFAKETAPSGFMQKKSYKKGRQ